MNDMIERMARVLCESIDRDPDQLEPGDAYGIDDHLQNGDPAHCLWRQHVEPARAILEAMREPTDLMGLGLSELRGEPYKPGSHSATEIWKAMIDKALQGGGRG